MSPATASGLPIIIAHGPPKEEAEAPAELIARLAERLQPLLLPNTRANLLGAPRARCARGTAAPTSQRAGTPGVFAASPLPDLAF